MKPTQPVSIDGIEFDALLEEVRTLSAESPDYPVEDGFVVQDSIILQPQTLDMILFLSNNPVTWKDRLGGDPNRVQSVTKQLEDMYFKKTPVTVVTPDKTYSDMAVVSISIPKTLENGASSRSIQISFKEIRKTETKTVSIPDSYGKSGATGVNAGTANTSTSSVGASASPSSDSANSEESKSSILYGLASKIGLFGD